MTAVGEVNSWNPADPEVARLLDRVRVLEHKVSDTIHGAEERWAQIATRNHERRNRLWGIALAVAAGVVCPLVVTVILAWTHLPR